MIRYHQYLAPMMVHRDDVTPDPDNYNNGDIDEIITSIEVNGCYRPIYVNKQTSQIVAGHHLYAALLEMGATRIPVAWTDGDATDAHRQMVADNWIARMARPDEAMFIQILDELQQTDLGLLGTGVSERQFEALRTQDVAWGLPPDPAPIDDNYTTHKHTCPECGHEWSD